ncbi:1-aminocyclopropane-1-carboxylate deaminase/D-cysteine desulfhydrase [Sediminibacterium ginsengisoli]|uniref:1-aminocyclopropane-1-carboxylate deaminase n=1 Tax=Sediminibacterium ginsengisoli TaxID=413434 RepID=A0A1T4QTU6_9BACT|nr:pyridoxal-phosphate dependent enzyme [Sediminibacterium ginsengisoli]SKA07084.1 1-aminocyclopropane-1-carboxylate deaminase [Sediminibacterium ginsengisoli]
MIVRNQNICLHPLKHFPATGITADVLRLDELHPVVSGNKWFKLQYYLEEALNSGADTIATFGGAYSNHIVATAFAAREQGLKTVGFIRGEEPPQLSHTLRDAKAFGMELVFLSREKYREPANVMTLYGKPGWLWVPEGGSGKTGADGAAGILDTVNKDLYSHIICAAGTGTTVAGLVKAASERQLVTGISVLKGYDEMPEAVKSMLNENEKQKPFKIIHEYHFGGYARCPETLLAFMRELWETETIPTDIVYTAKMFFGVCDLARKGEFPEGSRLLLIHTGGLQGNGSLPAGTLPF